MPQDPAQGRAAALSVTGLEAPRIGEIAAANRIVLHELTPQLGSLEAAFMEMTADSVEYSGDTPAVPQEPAGTTSPGSSQ
jgi:ABC-2 type transport system ATP-binding protein